MNEHHATITYKCDRKQVPKRIFEYANLGLMPTVESDIYRYVYNK